MPIEKKHIIKILIVIKSNSSNQLDIFIKKNLHTCKKLDNTVDGEQRTIGTTEPAEPHKPIFI